MRALVIGGTVFVGRAIVDAARRAGHDVTVLHRGSSPLESGDVGELLGDREDPSVIGAAAEAGPWDVVVDTCGYIPRAVDLSASLLAGACERYLFVSTVSVYADLASRGIDEGSALHDPPAPEVETVDADTYGPLKVACERAAEDALPGRVLLIRPGLLVGPHDPTGRFPHWVRRLDEAGPVLVPRTDQSLQVLDARDLGDWVVTAAEAGHVGPVNLVGPPGDLTWSGALRTLAEVADGGAELVEADPSWLLDREVRPWADLPLWLGPGEDDGVMHVDDSLARSLGLRTRPFRETAEDTLAWARATPDAGGDDRPGLDRGRETALLDELAG
jgi:2'-hydroxyisoflavone reductase